MDVAPGDMVRGGLGRAEGRVGLSGLRGFSQPYQFPDSMIIKLPDGSKKKVHFGPCQGEGSALSSESPQGRSEVSN